MKELLTSNKLLLLAEKFVGLFCLILSVLRFLHWKLDQKKLNKMLCFCSVISFKAAVCDF